jgi:flagella basal body P-ring formation protein FlgA
MSRLLPPLVFCCALAARAVPGDCIPAAHDPITAHDLAAALPEFAKLAPDTPVAPAPGPGVRRVFRHLELLSFARTHSLQLDSDTDLCFELPMETLDQNRMLEAMHAALPFPDTRIEVVDTSLYPVPRGRVEFRREDLGAAALPNSPAPVVWRGNVVYGANQRFTIWARVRVTARVDRLVATETIPRGSLVSANSVRMESGRAFPISGDTASSVDQVAGRVAMRVIEAGSEVHLSQLERPQDVKRGDTVEVEVHSGAARLAFTGKSEADGRVGDTIAVRNPRSNKTFQARVAGKDKALVDADLPEGN